LSCQQRLSSFAGLKVTIDEEDLEQENVPEAKSLGQAHHKHHQPRCQSGEEHSCRGLRMEFCSTPNANWYYTNIQQETTSEPIAMDKLEQNNGDMLQEIG
jgi:hypothetical protein